VLRIGGPLLKCAEHPAWQFVVGSVQNRDEDPGLGQALYDAAGFQNSDASEWVEGEAPDAQRNYKLESPSVSATPVISTCCGFKEMALGELSIAEVTSISSGPEHPVKDSS
jgi:hypothetical protein